MKLGELELSFVERQRRVNRRQFHGFSPHYPRCATREPSASGRWSKNQIVTPAAAAVYEHTKLCQMLFLPQSRKRRLFYATSQPLLITFSKHFHYYYYYYFFRLRLSVARSIAGLQQIDRLCSIAASGYLQIAMQGSFICCCCW